MKLRWVTLLVGLGLLVSLATASWVVASGPGPSYRQGFARSAAESERPQDWQGLFTLWAPVLGPNNITLRDWGGHQHHGTLTTMDPASDWVVDEEGYALDFDGGNDHVVLTTLGNVLSNSDLALTVNIRVNTGGDTGAGWLFGARSSSPSNSDRLDCRINRATSGDVAGAFNCLVGDSSGNLLNFGADSDSGVADGNWHDVTIVVFPSANLGAIYVDGISQSITYLTQNIAAAMGNFERALYLGGFNDGGAPLTPYTGRINKFGLYSRELPPQTIIQMAENPFGIVRMTAPDSVHSIQAAAATPQVIIIGWPAPPWLSRILSWFL